MSSGKTTKIESWVISILACHLLLVKPRMSPDDAENTVKISATITIGLPIFVALWAAVAINSASIGLDFIKVPLVVAVLIAVFGVSAVSDRVYDRNIVDIRRRADEIMQNPKRGKMWVRRRLFKIYVANVSVLTIILVLLKLIA